MGLFGKLFASASAEVSQKAANAEQALDMKVSKDLVEGVISGCLLVSFVDGSCDDEELEALEAVDLFPHTPHLECVSLWQKK